MSKDSIIKGAVILTIAGIITRILGFAYRIYMSNIIGAEGMGLYQLVLPIYTLAWSIACSGFTTTVSKLIAEEAAKKEYGNISRLLKLSVVITTLIGFILSLALYSFSGFMAVHILKDTRLIASLKILSLCFPFMAAGTCIRGYFYGIQESTVPAVNQVLEQCARMSIIYIFAGLFIPKGLSYTLALTIIGIVFEEAFSLAYIAFAYRFKNNKNPIKKAPNISNIKALGILISTSAPLTLNRVTGSLLSSFENILIPQKLVLYGLSQTEAISSFGQVTGMTMPLIYFPSAFLISLSISLVPAISEDFALNNIKKINYTVSKTLLFAAITGIGAACVFTVFAKELGLVIFKQDLSGQLILFSFMCPFLYIQLVLSGILNGLGYQLFLFKNSLIASFINIACVYLLVPIYGISGFIFGWFLSLVIICSLEIEKIHKNINLKINLIKWFILPSISASGTAILMNSFIKDIIFNMFNSAISLVVCLIITFIIYMFFITSTDCVSYEDISSLIFRNKLRLNQTD